MLGFALGPLFPILIGLLFQTSTSRRPPAPRSACSTRPAPWAASARPAGQPQRRRAQDPGGAAHPAVHRPAADGGHGRVRARPVDVSGLRPSPPRGTTPGADRLVRPVREEGRRTFFTSPPRRDSGLLPPAQPRATRASTVTIASADQMSGKPTRCSGRNCSPRTKTASRNWSVGARYWRNPIVESGSRRAAAPKHSSGTAVTTPRGDDRQRRSARPACRASGRRATPRRPGRRRPAGARNSVSTVRPTSESTGTTLRTRP